MSRKSKDAFRTISEVSDWLETPAHVLRFWEGKFSHVKPVKRAGGRRYYRTRDMELLGGIKTLLHVDGLSIKEVQDRIKRDGPKAIAALSPNVNEPFGKGPSPTGATAGAPSEAVADNVIPLDIASADAPADDKSGGEPEMNVAIQTSFIDDDPLPEAATAPQSAPSPKPKTKAPKRESDTALPGQLSLFGEEADSATKAPHGDRPYAGTLLSMTDIGTTDRATLRDLQTRLSKLVQSAA